VDVVVTRMAAAWAGKRARCAGIVAGDLAINPELRPALAQERFF